MAGSSGFLATVLTVEKTTPQCWGIAPFPAPVRFPLTH